MEFTLVLILMLLGVGLLAGFVAGFVGIGGGAVMVPVLLALFRHWGLPASGVVQAAMATSLVVAVGNVGSSIVRQAKQRRILWRLVPYLVPGSLGGGWLAARLATSLPGRLLEHTLAAVLLVVAVRMLTDFRHHDRDTHSIRWWQGLLVGILVGAVAGLSGLAGGVVMVPALAMILGLRAEWLAGTSSAVILWSALAAALGYLTATPPEALGPGFVGYAGLPIAGLLAVTAIPGAQLGAYVNRHANSRLFERTFALFLILVVVKLVVGS